MHFALIDTVLEAGPDRVVAVKNVSLAEEYLGDHFPGFPVLPGVLMLEAMVQAARHLLKGLDAPEWVLGQVRAMRYSSFVRPGESLRVEVTIESGTVENPNIVVETGTASFKGIASVVRGGVVAETAVSGRFTMRPPNLG